MATIVVVASAFLIYVSGSFLVAEVFGVKRYLQILLMLPIAVVASYYLLARPGRLLDPLICFVIVKTATEVALRGQWLYLLDDIAALLALIVLFAAPIRSVETGARLVVWLAGILSAMALVQWMVLFYAPQLAEYSLVVSDEDNVIENTIKHPIALLGMFGALQYSFLGHDVARLQSFALEPSLNVVYFLLPASLAKVHPRFRTPHVTTILTGVAVGVCAMFTSIDEMVDLTNIGTLFAFILVSIGVLVLRYKEPDRPRPFRVPFVWPVSLLSAAGCVFIMYGLPGTAWERFGIWLAIGLALYFTYGFTHSKLHTRG